MDDRSSMPEYPPARTLLVGFPLMSALVVATVLTFDHTDTVTLGLALLVMTTFLVLAYLDMRRLTRNADRFRQHLLPLPDDDPSKSEQSTFRPAQDS